MEKRRGGNSDWIEAGRTLGENWVRIFDPDLDADLENCRFGMTVFFPPIRPDLYSKSVSAYY